MNDTVSGHKKEIETMIFNNLYILRTKIEKVTQT